jgi:hypothetical protein
MASGTGNGADLRDRPVGELLKELSQETSTLVRQELALAKAEMREQGKQAGKGAGLFGGAGVVGFLALATLTAALVLGLSEVMAAWLAALIVGLVYAAIAGVLALTGKNTMQDATPPAPQTVETLKEDVEWAKTRKSSAAR